jgi:hypothetical protein
MLIGGDFNEKSNRLMSLALALCDHLEGENISVVQLNESLGFDRNELKGLLEYLESLDFIRIETIGGVNLYGHISITAKGVNRFNKTE